MSLILLNLQSNQQIKLDNQNPLIIGRKNVEGCFDKRVSRTHGRVTCTVDGKIRLEALHCNPCFFTRNGVPPVLQLNKDEEETLNEGDYLGLLPNAFWFKITSNKETKIKTELDNPNCTRTDEYCDENVRTSELDETSSTANSLEDKTVITKAEDNCMPNEEHNSGNLNPTTVPTSYTDINSAGPSKGFGSAEFEKTRRLPLWMYEIDEPREAFKSSNKRSAPDSWEKEKKLKLSQVVESDARTGAERGDEKADLDFPSTSKVETADKLPNPMCELQNAAQIQGESSEASSKKDGYESDVEHKRDDFKRRPICQYEGNCYRQNPQHKSQFCHPGDSDFVPYEERPFCQYGASCYRRNEKHRIEFRHPSRDSDSDSHNVSSSCSRNSIGEERPPCLDGSSCRNENPQHRKDLYHPPKASSPLPSKRRRKKIKMQNSDYEDDDEYELEDPFSNDASSDEYIPTDYEDEEEDLNTSREDE